jgi:hypothetical protein
MKTHSFLDLPIGKFSVGEPPPLPSPAWSVGHE